MEVKPRLSALRDAMLDDLLSNILPYWMDNMQDETAGGFLGRRDGYDRVDLQAGKAIILNTRILWTYSEASRILAHHGFAEQELTDRCRAMAERAYQYITTNFFDADHGGVYWMLHPDGSPAETKKQVYAQAFCIYALVAYYRLTGDRQALESAEVLFCLIEQHSYDPQFGGYLEAFDRSWNLLEDLRLSEKDANEKKTMNTHLHVLEAYTSLYRVWKNPLLAQRLKELVRLFLDRIVNADFHFRLFFDEQWNERPHPVSYGHDIEGSWLIYEAALVTGDQTLISESAAVAVAMASRAIEEGLDTDGGLMNEGEHGTVTDTDKHWWPQSEAIVGCVNAWQLTGEPKWMDAAHQVWNFIDKHLIDREAGEWHWRVDRDGQVCRDEDKAGPWKCPYHNGRAALEVLERSLNPPAPHS
ncbi:MAG: AGE family epimerase/isomerase [Bacteroidota bacterium]